MLHERNISADTLSLTDSAGHPMVLPRDLSRAEALIAMIRATPRDPLPDDMTVPRLPEYVRHP